MSLRRVLWAFVLVGLVSAGCAGDTNTDPAPTSAPGSTTSTPASSTSTQPPSTTVPGPDPTEIRLVEIAVDEFIFDARVAGPDGGPAVFLLHGFPSTSDMWRHQIAALAGAGYRVVAPDQRGYSAGARPPEVDDYTMDLIADDVAAIADALGIDEFHVVGHDFGGAAAWVVADRHAARVQSVTSVSTPHPSALGATLLAADSDQADRSSYVDAFVSPGSENIFLAGDGAALRGVYTDAGLTPEEMEAQLSVLNDADALIAALNWYRASFSVEGFATGDSTVATMFIWSTGDDFLGPDPAWITGDFVDAGYRFEVLPGVNHWVPEIAADRVSELLLDFLADPAAVSSTDPTVAFNDVADARFCEVFLSSLSQAGVGVEIFSTLGVNDCGFEGFVTLNPESIAEPAGTVVGVQAPRHFLPDRVAVIDGEHDSAEFGVLEFRRGGTFVADPDVTAAYSAQEVARDTVITWHAGRTIHELSEPDGTLWIMESYSIGSDPGLSIDDLGALGNRLTLPEGWSYSSRTLDEPLSLFSGGAAFVLRDDLGNRYELAAG